MPETDMSEWKWKKDETMKKLKRDHVVPFFCLTEEKSRHKLTKLIKVVMSSLKIK